jgi:DNA polymerase
MSKFEILSALRWWQEAGVDTIVDDAPRDWLRRLEAAPSAAPATSAPVVLAPTVLPGTIEAFQSWLLTTGMLPGEPSARLAPAGDAASGLMLLADAPEPADARAGMLMAGEVGRLFDRMLGAIGRDRSSIYLATMAPARPAGGRAEAALMPELIRLARHHVALAEPRLLLLLGDVACQAMLGKGLAPARGIIHELEHEGRSVRAIATFHPRFLLKQPARKAEAWQDLRMLLRELNG